VVDMNSLGQETIDALLATIARGSLAKAGISVSTGLVGYELMAPSKKVYPVLSPLRNRIARVMAPVGSKQATWRVIKKINSANVKAAVAEGTRNSAISYVEQDKAATYKTYGLDDIVNDEAVILGRGFEDVRALSALATLQSVMIEEEKLILGGIGSAANALGAPASITVTKASGTTGAWAGATDFVQIKVVALPLYGYLNSSLTDFTQPLADHGTLSAKGSVQLAATTDVVTAYCTPVNGAFAYAWFVADKATNNAADSEMYLMAITTIPAASFTSTVNTNWAASNVTADTSYDTNAFDGLMAQILNTNGTLTTLGTYTSGVLKQQSGGTDQTGALVYDMNATTAAGTTLTSDGSGGIKEFDVLLKALWDYSRIGPTLVLMNSQEALSVTRTIIGSTTGALVRLPVNPGDKSVVGGDYVTGYLNKFTSSLTPGNPDVIPFMIHPYLPPGTIVFLSERLPYPNSNVQNVLQMEMQLEYTDFEFARTTRQYPHGVYAMGTLEHFFPAGCGVIRSIAPS
jgi:hypothetical protein